MKTMGRKRSCSAMGGENGHRTRGPGPSLGWEGDGQVLPSSADPELPQGHQHPAGWDAEPGQGQGLLLPWEHMVAGLGSDTGSAHVFRLPTERMGMGVAMVPPAAMQTAQRRPLKGTGCPGMIT